MKRLLIVFLLLGYFSSGAYAVEPTEQKYAGVFYGIADSGDGGVKNGNLGLVIGGHVDSGIGIEFFYSDTIDGDDESTSLGKIRYESQIWGLLGTYRFGDKYYGLIKAGYTFLDLEAKITGLTREKWKEEGLSYGIGFGVRVGKNSAVELNYLVLPDVTDRILGFDVEFDNELYGLGYNWFF
ncbi:MAG: porin family protein [Gammaproteobacteria bacterium]|nr:porin family protein [Gammaproteobacteria bacterium]